MGVCQDPGFRSTMPDETAPSPSPRSSEIPRKIPARLYILPRSRGLVKRLMLHLQNQAQSVLPRKSSMYLQPEGNEYCGCTMVFLE